MTIRKKDLCKEKTQAPTAGPGKARKSKTEEVAEQVSKKVKTEKSEAVFPIVDISPRRESVKIPAVLAGDHPERPQVFLHKPYRKAVLQDALARAMEGIFLFRSKPLFSLRSPRNDGKTNL
jgi:hypothetical protein